MTNGDIKWLLTSAVTYSAAKDIIYSWDAPVYQVLEIKELGYLVDTNQETYDMLNGETIELPHKAKDIKVEEYYYDGCMQCKYYSPATHQYRYGLAYHSVVIDAEFPEEIKVMDVYRAAAEDGFDADMAIKEYIWQPLCFN